MLSAIIAHHSRVSQSLSDTRDMEPTNGSGPKRTIGSKGGSGSVLGGVLELYAGPMTRVMLLATGITATPGGPGVGEEETGRLGRSHTGDDANANPNRKIRVVLKGGPQGP